MGGTPELLKIPTEPLHQLINILMKLLNAIGFLVLLGLPVELSAQSGSTGINRNDTSAAQPRPHQDPEGFREEVSGLRTASSGKSMPFRTYRGSQGTMLEITSGVFGSPAKAKAELRTLLRSASKVIEHGPKKTSSGQIVGDRVVASYADSQPIQRTIIIAWTKGSEYYLLETTAPLPRARQFEQRIEAGADLGDPVDKSN